METQPSSEQLWSAAHETQLQPLQDACLLPTGVHWQDSISAPCALLAFSTVCSSTSSSSAAQASADRAMASCLLKPPAVKALQLWQTLAPCSACSRVSWGRFCCEHHRRTAMGASCRRSAGCSWKSATQLPYGRGLKGRPLASPPSKVPAIRLTVPCRCTRHCVQLCPQVARWGGGRTAPCFAHSSTPSGAAQGANDPRTSFVIATLACRLPPVVTTLLTCNLLVSL